MILSHKEIEEIAVAVTKDFNEFFSALIPMGRVCLAVRRLTSLPANISASMSLCRPVCRWKHLWTDGLCRYRVHY